MDTSQKTWAIIGASRGIGYEFVKQLLERGDRVFATVRKEPSSFFPEYKDRLQVLTCDVADDRSINQLVGDLESKTKAIDHVVINAGVLHYPNRATELSFDAFEFHLRTNTVGPIICAQRLLKSDIDINTITFMSSDSGSAQRFDTEDGFAAYAASKAALNQALRHMAVELQRKGGKTTILALHPGEVKTDMASMDLGHEIPGQMTPQESVSACIQTIESKGSEDSGTFWTWENKPYPW